MRKIDTVVFLILLLLIPNLLRADWPCRPDTAIPIAIRPGNQWNLHLITDTRNGSIVAWQDRRNGTTDHVYIQRVDLSGNMLWQDGGIPLAATAGYQYFPQLIADGSGGAFIAWQDNRSGVDYDIYIQHVTAAGNLTWTANGVIVCNASGHQYNPQLAPDGRGGIIVIWQDHRGADFDIYAQLFDINGQALWTPNGVPVCTASGDQVQPHLVADGQNGAVAVWDDYRGGSGFSDVYAQRVLFNGTQGWIRDGIAVASATGNQYSSQIVTDGKGGALIAWQDRRNGADNIYAQHVLRAGTFVWAQNGIQIAPASGLQYYPQLAADSSGGAVIVWQDNRTGANYDIYAQRVDGNGQILWLANGTPVCTAAGHQYYPQVVCQKSGPIFVWQDKRSGNFDIYAQRLNLQGQPQWPLDGAGIATLPLDQFAPQLVGDGAEGAIVGWSDYHLGDGSTDIYAHRVGANGLPGGGCYRTFSQDSLGIKAVRYIRSKRIVARPNAGNVRDSIFTRGALPLGITIGIDRSDSSKYYAWEYFSKAMYIKKAFPQTGTPRPFDYRNGRALYGRMKNPNLSRYNNQLAGELLALKVNIAASDCWLTNEHFGDLVYRDTTQRPGILHNKKLRSLVLTVDSVLTFWRWYSNVNYSGLANTLHMINAAFDGRYDTASGIPLRIKPVKALFSIPFLVPSADPPSIIPALQPQPPDEADMPSVMELDQNYPNPFNPATTIEFSLPEPAIVTMKVYNILGQEVATLLNKVQIDDGRQAVDFDASRLSSGVYFYRIAAEPLSGGALMAKTKKMLLVK